MIARREVNTVLIHYESLCGLHGGGDDGLLSPAAAGEHSGRLAWYCEWAAERARSVIVLLPDDLAHDVERLCAHLPNVSVDTSGGWYDSEMVEYAVRHLGRDRVLFGSDYPGRDYAPQKGRVEGTTLPQKVKERVLWRNAAEILGLEKRGR